MICPGCQFENPPDSRFCGQCGSRLAPVCPRCGAEASPGFRFCGQCGAPLEGGEEAAPEPRDAQAPPRGGRTEDGVGESEIKQATVLCCELTSTGAADDEGEALHGVLSRFLELAREEIGRFGGVVDQVLGRGVLALFGAPEAQEDHAERAVLTAAALRSRVAQMSPGDGGGPGSWSLRMGLDSGPVIVGGAGGTAVGRPIDRARSLLARAELGEVLLSDELAARVRSMVPLDEAPGPETTGEGRSAPSWRLTDAPLSVGEPRRFLGWKLSPFVGREREMTLLEELRRQSEAGQGQVVGITGEPGLGKSRLLYELSTRLQDLPVSYLRGRCQSYASGIPYFPFVDMIRRASQVGEADEPSAVADKLSANLEAVGLPPEETLPYFLRLLGLRQGDDPLAGTEPQAIKAQTFRAMRRMVLTTSRRSPVVMELEDLHWIDETSAEFLDSLIEEMAGARLLVLLTYRTGYQPSWLQKSYATQITVRRLSSEESRHIVGSMLDHADATDPAFARIVDRAEGNPFFLEELSRVLTNDPGDESDPSIPGTVQGVLMARIDHLPEAHKRLLQVASVLGGEISLRLLEELWDRPEPLAELLADLQHREFFFTAPREDATVYSFRHALTQEVAYESLLKRRRKALHARVAQALEALYADRLEDVYDRLIYHYPRAGDAERTVHYLVLFAERAALQYAHAEAARALTEALEHAGRLPREERDRRLLEVLLRLAESLLPLARLPETLELCLAHQDAVARLGDPSVEARYRFWLAHTYTYLGHPEETQREAKLAIAAAQSSGDQATEGKAWYVLGRNAFWAGDFAAGLEQSRRALVLLERSGEAWWQGQAYWVAGFHHWALGQFPQALESLRRASEIGDALDDYRLDASWSIGFVEASLGNWQGGIEHCHRAIDGSRDPLNTALATGFLGYAYLQKGDLEPAIQTLRESTSRLAEAGMRQLQGWLTVFLGEAYLAAGRIEDGREIASEALEVSRGAQFDYGAGLAQRALGRMSLAAGRTDAGTRELGDALETFRRLGAPFEEARTHLALAGAGGAPEGGDDHLAEALRLFRALEVPAYVEQAEALAVAPRAADAPVASS